MANYFKFFASMRPRLTQITRPGSEPYYQDNTTSSSIRRSLDNLFKAYSLSLNFVLGKTFLWLDFALMLKLKKHGKYDYDAQLYIG